ncbi:recombinase RecT [Terribacillus saccharophilus]|uniref:recombinase RecT n=1 Tax=Terribacillus saccharophilus TaxID=361277 RepID=UPI000BA7C0E2|nr:recombinase RecT [Terribacillus saccharophilus]PAF15929.1 recombinase [Terribacillus saccharophilus]
MSKSNELALVKKDTVDVVATKVKEFQENGELHFPASYSPENAMKSAWLILQTIKTGKNDGGRPALEVCTKDSIANSLLDMVVQGLSPSKKQGYFIVYGNQLTFQRSYFGTMAVTKRVTGAKAIDAAVIYEGDEVNYEMLNGRVQNLTHKQKFGNIDKEKIVGAYCTITLPDDEYYHEIMTIEELRQAWSKAQFWGKDQAVEKKGSTHDEFKQEMAKKTVINRACKKFLNSSDDSSLLMNHFNGSDDRSQEAQAQQEIRENANGDFIDIEVTEPVEQLPIEHKPVDEDGVIQEEKQHEEAETGGPGF